jgi:hypothetical protein
MGRRLRADVNLPTSPFNRPTSTCLPHPLIDITLHASPPHLTYLIPHTTQYRTPAHERFLACSHGFFWVICGAVVSNSHADSMLLSSFTCNVYASIVRFTPGFVPSVPSLPLQHVRLSRLCSSRVSSRLVSSSGLSSRLSVAHSSFGVS